MSNYTLLDDAIKIASCLVRLGIPEDRIGVGVMVGGPVEISLWVRPDEKYRRALDILGQPSSTKPWRSPETGKGGVTAGWIFTKNGRKVSLTWHYYGEIQEEYKDGRFVRDVRNTWDFRSPSAEDADALADVWLAGRTD